MGIMSEPWIANKNHRFNTGKVMWLLLRPQGFGGGKWADLVGKNDGVATNMAAGAASGFKPTNRPAGYGNALLDGTNDFVKCGTASAISFDLTNAFSVGFWLRTTAVTSGVVIGKDQGTGSFTGWLISPNQNNAGSTSSGLIRMVMIGAGTVSTQTASACKVNNGSWNRYDFTYDGSRSSAGILIYENGQSLAVTASGTSSGSMLCANNLTIGGYDNSTGNIACSIDDVSIWPRTLAAAEIAAIYNLSRQGYPGMLIRGSGWRFGKSAVASLLMARRRRLFA